MNNPEYRKWTEKKHTKCQCQQALFLMVLGSEVIDPFSFSSIEIQHSIKMAKCNKINCWNDQRGSLLPWNMSTDSWETITVDRTCCYSVTKGEEWPNLGEKCSHQGQKAGQQQQARQVKPPLANGPRPAFPMLKCHGAQTGTIFVVSSSFSLSSQAALMGSNEALRIFRAEKAMKSLAPQTVHLDRNTLNPGNFWHLHSWGLCVPWN